MQKTENVRGAPWELICNELDNIFGDVPDSGFVKLSSIHRAKGLEFERVFYLVTDNPRRPLQAWEKQAEDNLRYVAATRAMQSLILIPVQRTKEGWDLS
jgi:superfamily I DNA/RNA helicase